MDIIKGVHLLVDGDPLSYRFGAINDPDDAWRSLKRYITQVENACYASRTTIYLTGPDCMKGYRYHVARIKPYQGNRTKGKPSLPSRKYLWNKMLDNGAISNPILEADDMLVATGNQDPSNSVILSPDKDLKQSLAPVWMDEEKAPYDGYFILKQILTGDRADNIPALLRGYGNVKAEKFLKSFEDGLEARRAVLELAEGDYLRLAEITALVALGASRWPSGRIKGVWGDMIPPEILREIDERCLQS